MYIHWSLPHSPPLHTIDLDLVCDVQSLQSQARRLPKAVEIIEIVVVVVDRGGGDSDGGGGGGGCCGDGGDGLTLTLTLSSDG